LKLNKFKFFILLLPYTISNANVNYAIHNNYTLTLPKGVLSVNYAYLLLNDTVDIFNSKY
jgi:hypothetical protein